MGIITRFKDIMAANFNALLDRCENPEKMVNQHLRNMEQEYQKFKEETASIMAEKTSARRKLDECESEIAKMTEYAKKAVTAGNDNEARQFLEKKSELTQKQEVLVRNYEMACDNSAKMRQMHDKLEADISDLKSRREMLKAKVKVAETQKRMSGIGSGLESAGSNLAAFDKMEEKVNKMLDEADAMNELNKQPAKDSAAELARKYDAENKKAAVDDELAALKAEMGM